MVYLYRNRDPRENSSPAPSCDCNGATRTNRKNAWCSTQHLHKCLQADFRGVSKPYVLTSFYLTKKK